MQNWWENHRIRDKMTEAMGEMYWEQTGGQDEYRGAVRCDKGQGKNGS